MLAEKIDYIHNKQNTYILVEHSLFASGISSILKKNQMASEIIKHEQINNVHELDSLLICKVSSNEMEIVANEVIKKDNTSKVLLIKTDFTYSEIENLLETGIKGVLHTDLNEKQLLIAITSKRGTYHY